MNGTKARTALDLSAEEWERYDPIAAIQQRQSAVRKELALRRRRALRTVRKASRVLHDVFGAQRVVLFGSLAEDNGFTLWSDIDLAAWGINPQQFYAAVAAVTALSAEFEIDLIDPDFCRPSLRHIIEHQGIDI